MNDDALLPEWDRDPGKTAAIDARLQEIVLQHIANDPHWVRTVMALADDLLAFDQVPEMLSSICTFITNLAIWTYGQQEAVARFTADLQQLRAIAIKEAGA
jgi:hypothetical protein